MTRVTSKLQVTIPKAIADRYGIAPGEEIEWLPAGEAIRVVPPTGRQPIDRERRLELFDLATERQQARQSVPGGEASPTSVTAGTHRGWRRADLYERGRTD
jgi:AbrB family looped-hinge helix DNA binding protein